MNQSQRDPEPLGIVLIHGAAVVMEGRALIFLGPSRTGKSTITRLLEPFVQVIGDDKLYLIPQEHNWTVADATIRAREGALTEEEARMIVGAPLYGVFRLFQYPETQIVPIDTLQTCRYLSIAFYELHYWSRHLHAQFQKAVFSNIADISRKARGFELCFHKSVEIVEDIRHAFSMPLPK